MCCQTSNIHGHGYDFVVETWWVTKWVWEGDLLHGWIFASALKHTSSISQNYLLISLYVLYIETRKGEHMLYNMYTSRTFSCRFLVSYISFVRHIPVPLVQVNNKKTLVCQCLLSLVKLIQFDLLSATFLILPQIVYVFVKPSGQSYQFLS